MENTRGGKILNYCLLCKQEDPSLDPQYPCINQKRTELRERQYPKGKVDSDQESHLAYLHEHWHT